MTVGIVVVSHSAQLADGAADLARAMATTAVPLAIAAGIDDPSNPLGSDPLRVRAAIDEVYSNDGVLVLMDMGSALLSAEFALDLLDPDRRPNVVLCDAPLVEGLVAAAVQAMSGASLATVAAHARAALDGKREHLAGPALQPVGIAAAPAEDPTATATFTVRTPHGLHARPAAAIVRTTAGRPAMLRNLTARTGPVPTSSLNGILTLGVRQGHLIQVEASGPTAEQLIVELEELARRNFETDTPITVVQGGHSPPIPALRTVPSPRTEQTIEPDGTLSGLTAAPGLAIGPLTHLTITDTTTNAFDSAVNNPAGSRDDERQRLHTAIDGVAKSMRRTIADLRAPEVAAILESQLLTLSDPLVTKAAETLIETTGCDAAAAWRQACDEVIKRIGGLTDAYLATRAADLSALRDEVTAHLAGGDDLAEATGVVCDGEISAMQAAELDPARVVAVVTAGGSPSAHSAVILRAAGIPAVFAVGGAILAVPTGTTIAVDADAGTVHIDPQPDALAATYERVAQLRATHHAAAAAARHAARTRDGVLVRVAANIASPADALRAAAYGADGVGLLRSEFIFASRSAPPTEDEQFAIYSEIGTALAGRPIVLRTIDVGGDKPLVYLDQPHEANPFLGVRGIRLALTYPDLLRTQLRAALRTAANHPLQLMLPMVTMVEEIHHARQLLDESRNELVAAGIPVPVRASLGVMIETPAAALKAASIVTEVDFVSIGTNDLTQYTMAADRGNAGVSYLLRDSDAAVLRLIEMVCSEAASAGVPVAVCGAAAEDPTMIPTLIGLGVRELSVPPPRIAAVKEQVRSLDVGVLRATVGGRAG